MHIPILFLRAYEFYVIKLQIGNCIFVKKKGLLPDRFSDNCFNLTVTYIHITLEVRIPPVYCRTVRKFSLRFQRTKTFNSHISEIQNASNITVFASKRKLFSLAFFLFFAFCIICSHFFFFFFVLALLALSIFSPFNDYFLCYKEIVRV